MSSQPSPGNDGALTLTWCSCRPTHSPLRARCKWYKLMRVSECICFLCTMSGLYRINSGIHCDSLPGQCHKIFKRHLQAFIVLNSLRDLSAAVYGHNATGQNATAEGNYWRYLANYRNVFVEMFHLLCLILMAFGLAVHRHRPMSDILCACLRQRCHAFIVSEIIILCVVYVLNMVHCRQESLNLLFSIKIYLLTCQISNQINVSIIILKNT